MREDGHEHSKLDAIDHHDGLAGDAVQFVSSSVTNALQAVGDHEGGVQTIDLDERLGDLASNWAELVDVDALLHARDLRQLSLTRLLSLLACSLPPCLACLSLTLLLLALLLLALLLLGWSILTVRVLLLESGLRITGRRQWPRR